MNKPGIHTKLRQRTVHKPRANSYYREVVYELQASNTVKIFVCGCTPAKIQENQTFLQNIWYAASTDADMDATY
jgi:hypothetical protein